MSVNWTNLIGSPGHVPTTKEDDMREKIPMMTDYTDYYRKLL